ncbi:hypothetical protein PsorP6_000552 [Peronosclerospora sorghi]|uniref:Uncharacterized protein n=1 Tax=Peronosclerospora sorghi TaxID=230839 RepID=A0ACC0WS23_9STRA|nr:hypothetical protein PsorP6_000552 [Peronosclerospora sorghi]
MRTLVSQIESISEIVNSRLHIRNKPNMCSAGSLVTNLNLIMSALKRRHTVPRTAEARFRRVVMWTPSRLVNQIRLHQR